MKIGPAPVLVIVRRLVGASSLVHTLTRTLWFRIYMTITHFVSVVGVRFFCGLVADTADRSHTATLENG